MTRCTSQSSISPRFRFHAWVSSRVSASIAAEFCLWSLIALQLYAM